MSTLKMACRNRKFSEKPGKRMAEPVEFGQTPLKAERKTVCHFRDQKAAGSNPATSTQKSEVPFTGASDFCYPE